MDKESAAIIKAEILRQLLKTPGGMYFAQICDKLNEGKYHGCTSLKERNQISAMLSQMKKQGILRHNGMNTKYFVVKDKVTTTKNHLGSPNFKPMSPSERKQLQLKGMPRPQCPPQPKTITEALQCYNTGMACLHAFMNYIRERSNTLMLADELRKEWDLQLMEQESEK